VKPQAVKITIRYDKAHAALTYFMCHDVLKNNLKLHTDDGGFKRQLPADEALHFASDALVTFPDFLDEQVEALTGQDLLTELAVFDPAEPDEAFPAHDFSGVEARRLRGRFDHQDTGEKRPTGDVTAHPEFVGVTVLEREQPLGRFVDPDHPVDHLKLVPLRVHLTDGVLVEKDVVEVDRRKVKEN